MSTRHGGIFALVAAIAVAGCSGVDGVASPGSPVGSGPFTAIQADLDLVPSASGRDFGLLEMATFGHGGAYIVLLTPGEAGVHLIAVPPDGAGFGEPRTAELPPVDVVDDLIATRDGRVVVVGRMHRPDSSSTDFGVAVLDPDTGEGPVHVLLAEGSRDTSYSAVSADGRTLVSVVAVDLGDEDVIRLLVVDLTSGEVTASRDLERPPGKFRYPVDVVRAPDGSVAAELVVSVDAPDQGDDYTYLELVRFGPDLEPRGEPLALTGPEDDFDPGGLAMTADGTVVALLEDASSRIVAIAPDASEPQVLAEPDDRLSSLIVDPSGHWAYTTDANEEPIPVDLTTGEVGSQLEPCGAGEGLVSLEGMLVSRGGGSLLIAGSCSGGTERLWRLGPAA